MGCRLFICAVGALTLLPAVASAQCEPTPQLAMTDLVRLGRCQLLALYGSSDAGTIPQGFVAGRAFDPSRPLAPARSWLLSRTLWQGKVFLDDSHLVNIVMRKERVPGAVLAVLAEIDKGDLATIGEPIAHRPDIDRRRLCRRRHRRPSALILGAA